MCKLLLDAIQKQSKIGEHDRMFGPWATEEGKLTVSSTKFDLQHVEFDYKKAGSFRGRIIPAEWHDPIPLKSGTESDKEILIINYWLRNCQVNHPGCVKGDAAFMPTRVVDVGLDENHEPRLVLTASLDVSDRRYLALSHCWGLTMPSTATTTLSTIPDRLREIPITGLTRTFADFIGVARKMRVQYVWIDSLCIIQDSKEDWEDEAAQMASVYSNAYCTIAASSSANGDGGCHVDPGCRPFGPVRLTFNEEDENGSKIIQIVQVFSTFGLSLRLSNVSVLAQDPLHKRGWTFQERELSTRMLHYSQDTIRWECRSLKASLEFPWHDSNAFNGLLRTFDSRQTNFRQTSAPTSNSQPDPSQKARDQEAWFTAIERYTSRALTKQSDKLPALSGIARAVQAHTGDRYLAGLWESNLIFCLLWYSEWHPAGGDPVFDPSKPAHISHIRQTEYTAPSWSWASINGNVGYQSWIFGALDPDPLTGPNARLIPQILGAQTVPLGKDEYGQLKGGWVTLTGKMKAAFTKGEGFARQDREGIYDIHEGRMREVGMIKYDVPADSPAGQTQVVVCLCMLPRAEQFGDSVGLAIVPTGGEDEYRRVGLFLFVKLAWWDDCVDGTITLV